MYLDIFRFPSHRSTHCRWMHFHLSLVHWHNVTACFLFAFTMQGSRTACSLAPTRTSHWLHSRTYSIFILLVSPPLSCNTSCTNTCVHRYRLCFSYVYPGKISWREGNADKRVDGRLYDYLGCGDQADLRDDVIQYYQRWAHTSTRNFGPAFH